jgi:Uma2 family endonuclease
MTIPSITMLPYDRQGEIDYASLEFNPDEPPDKPDAMEQHLEQAEVFQLLSARFTEFNQRPDVFLDFDSYICYDRNNLNVRVSPDIYLVFGVDARAIRPRKLYLPWETGKPPDWALEIASESTAREDVNRKPAIYARMGIPEYWRFDPTGGNYHGVPLWGGVLENGAYRPIELTIGPDGVLTGHSPVLGLSLCWDEGWPRFYDPSTGAYLETWREVQAARAEAETRANTAEAELRRLRDQLQDRRPE